MSEPTPTVSIAGDYAVAECDGLEFYFGYECGQMMKRHALNDDEYWGFVVKHRGQIVYHAEDKDPVGCGECAERLLWWMVRYFAGVALKKESFTNV